MKDAIVALLGSRKFLVVVLGTLVAAALTIARVIPASDFLSTLRALLEVLIAAIGVENAAEKLLVPPSSRETVPYQFPAMPPPSVPPPVGGPTGQ